MKQAQSKREALWSPGSFLDILSHHIDVAFRSRSPKRRCQPLWSVIISTESKAAAFSAWLACKFDLGDHFAMMDNADVEVQALMVDAEDDISCDVS